MTGTAEIMPAIILCSCANVDSFDIMYRYGVHKSRTHLLGSPITAFYVVLRWGVGREAAAIRNMAQ